MASEDTELLFRIDERTQATHEKVESNETKLDQVLECQKEYESRITAVETRTDLYAGVLAALQLAFSGIAAWIGVQSPQK